MREFLWGGVQGDNKSEVKARGDSIVMAWRVVMRHEESMRGRGGLVKRVSKGLTRIRENESVSTYRNRRNLSGRGQWTHLS